MVLLNILTKLKLLYNNILSNKIADYKNKLVRRDSYQGKKVSN